ncbi:MAG: ChaN family lipoprotein [Armatimonas sp.]
MGTNWRFVEARTGRAVSEKTVLNALAQADAVFVGEQHNDPQTHLVEFWLWQQLAGRWRNSAALAMEMLERDGQKPLEDYLAGRIDEPTFRKSANFWKTYDTDYRAMVEDAKSRRVPVVGSNAPQTVVRKVGREGLVALGETDKTFVAWPVLAPEGDEYHKRFVAVMKEGAAHGGMAMNEAQIGRTYQAQCLRDQSMAEAVAKALDSGRRVMHVNGSFHSDAGLGTVQRLLWLRPRTRVALVKCHPINDPARADVSKLTTEADWLVVVPGKSE